MRLESLVLILCIPITFTSQAEIDDLFFTTGKMSTDISLGSLSEKTKERVYIPMEGEK